MPQYQQRKRNQARGNDENDSFDAGSPIPTSIPSTSAQVSGDAANKIGDIDNLLNEERNPGGNFSYHPEGSAKADSPAALGQDEAAAKDSPSGASGALGDAAGALGGAELGAGGVAAGAEGLYAGAENPRNLIKRLRWTKRKTIFGSAIGILTGGAIFGGIIASGPLEIIHVSEILMHSYSKSSSDSQSRGNALFRYYRFAKTGDIRETNVGAIGSRMFGPIQDQLADIGVTMKANRFSGSTIETQIDTAKLQKQYPELKSMNAAEQRNFLSDKFNLEGIGLSAEDLKLGVSTTGGNTFTIDSTRFGIGQARLLNKATIGVLDRGWTMSTIKTAVLNKFTGNPSLRHPIKRAVTSQTNKVLTAAELRAQERDYQKQLTEQSQAQGQAAEEEIKTKATGFQGLASKALLVTAAVCTIRSVADAVETVNRAEVVEPAALVATTVISAGQQLKSNQDINPYTVASLKSSFYSKDGNIYHAKAFRALGNLDGAGEATGTEIPDQYKQAFSNQTSPQKLKDSAGGGSFGAVACSPAGIILQVAGSVLLAVSGAADGGASWGVFAAKFGASFAAGAAATYMVTQIATSHWASDAIPAAMGTPVGGDLLAYGSRAAANLSSYAGGAISTGQNAVTDLTYDNQEAASFRSESMFARVFDIKDYRSLTGRLADTLSPSWGQNLSTMASGIASIGQSIPHLFSALMPKAAAGAQDTDQNYDWGFPQAGIPDFMLKESQLANPYSNGAGAASIIKSDPDGFASRVKNCFGDSIGATDTGALDFVPQSKVDPNSDAYNDAHCDDVGKDWDHATPDQQNWQRVVMAVNDTMDAKAMACHQGDDQSCADLGMGQSQSGGSNSSTTSTVSGDATSLAQQVLAQAASGRITLAASAKSDIQATANGQKAQPGPDGDGSSGADGRGNCQPVGLNPALLQVMLNIATKYQYQINDIVSGHQCDDAQHPKGRAMDIFDIAGQPLDDSWWSSSANVATINDIGNIVHTTGSYQFGFGVGCSATSKVPALGNLVVFNDSCGPQDELHIDVRGAP